MLSSRELEVLGAALYISEGTKARVDNRGWSHYDIEFTNNDPRVITAFLLFLRNIIGVEESRLKLQLFIYPDLNKDILVEYWSSKTGIPRQQFQKVILLKVKKKNHRHSKYGTVKIRYSHKKQFLKIEDIIKSIFGGVA